MSKILGVINWFNYKRGYGFVESPLDGKFHVHISQIRARIENVVVGTPLVFEKFVREGNKSDSAINCRPVKHASDWRLIIHFLDIDDSIQLTERRELRHRKGHKYYDDDVRTIRLKEKAAQELLKDKSRREIVQIVIEFFDRGLDHRLFISYCDFVTTLISNRFNQDESSEVLSEIFLYFHEKRNSRLIFDTWKHRKFQYLAYEDGLDYEIPLTILHEFISQIGVNELERIKLFHGTTDFCRNSAILKLKDIDGSLTNELKSFFSYLQYLKQDEKQFYQELLEKRISDLTLNDFHRSTIEFETIDSEENLNKAIKIKTNLLFGLPEGLYFELDQSINRVIIKRTVEDWWVELWLKGISEKPGLNHICDFFNYHPKKQLLIFLNLENQERADVCQFYSECNDIEESIRIIEYFLDKVDNFHFDDSFDEVRRFNLKRFSFKSIDHVRKIAVLLPEVDCPEEFLQILRIRMDSEFDDFSSAELLEIIPVLLEYKIVKEEKYIIFLFLEREINLSELKNIFNLNQINPTDPEIRSLLQFNFHNYSSWDKIELLADYLENEHIAKALIEEYFGSNLFETAFDFHWLVKRLIKSGNVNVVRYFIDSTIRNLIAYFPLQIFELSLWLGYIDAQRVAYKFMEFKSDSDLMDFLSLVEKEPVCDAVKLENTKLTSLLNFFASNGKLEVSDELKQYVEENLGLFDTLLAKRMICWYHERKVSLTELSCFLRSFHWFQISAVILRMLVDAASSNERFDVGKLDRVYKEHFEALREFPMSRQNTLTNFKISGILNRCNGRKHYQGEFRNKHGVNRWYVGHDVYTRVTEMLDCFCDGRFWKKDHFWHEGSNSRTVNAYNFFICRSSYCAERNDEVNLHKQFYQWTIMDVAKALDIVVDNNSIATLAGWANRMNKIVDRLFCRTCNAALRPLPLEPRILGYYSVPLFRCINDKCDNREIIRFTHCNNGRCSSHKSNEPLDSRDCGSCNPDDTEHRGLKCRFCGSVCPFCRGDWEPYIVQDE